MKKFLSVILALVLVLSLSVVAFADEVKYTPTTAFTFDEILKTYDSENDVQVGETLQFVSAPDSANPDSTNLTVSDLVVANRLEELPITVNVPSFSKAGVYNFTITETAGNTAGVTYTTSTIYVVIMVEYDNTEKALVIADLESYIKEIDGVKTDTFENTFKSGSFTVAKDVQGNMANVNDEFEIVVTLTSAKPVGTPITVGGQSVAASAWTLVDGLYTYTKTLTISKADGATAFADIPVGVEVAVAETKTAEKLNGYTYKSGDETFTIADDTAKAVVIVNDKTTEIDTGISLDSMPYVVLLTVAALGVAVILTKKFIAE